MADPVAIANEFVKFYYATFDAGRANLGPVYVRVLCAAVGQLIDAHRNRVYRSRVETQQHADL